MGCMDGKVAIVTGGGRGLGREHCLLLAQQGARVVVADLGGSLNGDGKDEGPAEEVVRLIQEQGGEAVAVCEDVTSFDGGRRIVECAVDTFGDLHTLINNAGIVRDRSLYKMSEEEFDAVIAVHLKGHFTTTRHASAFFRDASKAGKTDKRHIVNTTSGAGLMGNRGQTNYAAAKAGIACMTMVWAVELGGYGVTTNAVAPIARTRMTTGTFGALEVPTEGFDVMNPANVSKLVVYLGSDLCTANGDVFSVHGADIDRQKPWQQAKAISRDSAWTVQELSERFGELY